MTHEVANFHGYIKHISAALTQLLSAKEIIRDKHDDIFVAKVRELCQTFSEHLNSVAEVFVPWNIYVAKAPQDQ